MFLWLIWPLDRTNTFNEIEDKGCQKIIIIQKCICSHCIAQINFSVLRTFRGRPSSLVRYPNWFNSMFEFCAKLIQFNIQFKIILGKFNSKDYSNLDKSLLFNSTYYSIYNKLLWFNSIYYSINNHCLWFNSKDYSNLEKRKYWNWLNMMRTSH